MNKKVLTTQQLDKIRGGDIITEACSKTPNPSECEDTARNRRPHKGLK